MKILVAGDYCPQYRVQDIIDKGDFASVLGEVKNKLSEYDYSIVNLECPVAEGDNPIIKWGPNLRTNKAGVDAIKWSGFDCVTLANNHFNDYGEVGVNKTIEVCRELGLDYVGGGENLEEATRTLYKEIKGKTLAIINCCENEFSIAGPMDAGSAPLDPIRQYYEIQEAKKKAEYVLVIVHGGHEFFQLPSPRMIKTYRFFVDAGADAVINHHQHCYSGYEVYREKPIFYGLGNFCFDWRPCFVNNNWNYGFMVSIAFNESNVSFEIIPYTQCSEVAGIRLLPKNSFDVQLDSLNMIINSPIELDDRITTFYRESSFYCAHSILEPISNRYYLAAVKRNYVPSLISKKRWLRAENYVSCESHRDKLIYCLRNNL